MTAIQLLKIGKFAGFNLDSELIYVLNSNHETIGYYHKAHNWAKFSNSTKKFDLIERIGK